MPEYTFKELKSKANDLINYIYELSRVIESERVKRILHHSEMMKRSTAYAKEKSNGDPIRRLEIDVAYTQGWLDCVDFLKGYNDK